MQDPNAQEKSDAPKKKDESSNTEQNPATPGPQGAAIRITSAGSPEVLIRMEGIPTTLQEALSAISRPASFWTSLFRDIAPGLTSLAAVLISLAALIYTSHQKNVAERTAQEQRDKSNEAATKKLSADIIRDFASKLPPIKETHSARPSDDKDEKIEEFNRTYEVAAIRVAVYGDQALPALKMALGSQDRGLQHGGILIAEQMYRAETIDHRQLTKDILGFFSTSSPTLRRGVLDWLLEMNIQLSPDEERMAYEVIKTSFGENGELCSSQNEDVAVRAVNLLNRWAFPDSRLLLLGIVTHCRDEANPNLYIGARDSAVQPLPRVARSLSREQCDVLLNQDLPKLKDLSDLIDGASKSIQTICASK